MNDLAVYMDGREVCLDIAEGYKWRLERMLRELVAMDICGELDDSESEALHCLSQAYSVFSKALDKLRLESEISAEGYQPSIIMTGSVGRPKFDISREQLEELLQSRFSVPDIAHLLGVSVSTIRRRMSFFNLSVHQTYTCISDDDLDAVIMEVQEKFPNWGNRLMYGYLITSRIRVPFHRVRESQRRVDPEGSFMRKLRYLNRRQYMVPGPQWLWHIDGNHKLIR